MAARAVYSTASACPRLAHAWIARWGAAHRSV